MPTWFIRRYPDHKKRIYISLLTKDVDVAKIRVQLLSIFTAKLLTKIRGRQTINSNQPDINTMLREYRNYIARAEPYEQEAVYWGKPEFERVIEIIEQQLHLIKEYQLLEFVDEDFNNIEELLEKIKIKHKRSRDAEVDTILGDPKHVSLQALVEDNKGEKTNITLSDLLKAYIDKSEKGVSPKTTYKMKTHIEFLIECVGDIKVVDFDKDKLRDYRNKLDKKTTVKRGKPVPLNTLTKNDHLRSCKKLFDHATGFYEGIVDNHFNNQRLLFKNKKQVKVNRVPFSDDDLRKMFSHSVFTEGRFKHPYYYWIPLLALYTGSRANELSQLRNGDIIEVDGVWCISHNLSTEDKSIKSDKERLVPIHPKLIELGFLEFIALFRQKKYQWEEADPSHRLFKGLSLDKTRGGYQKNLSRWFNGTSNPDAKRYGGFKVEVGIKISDKQMKDFHSFRHTFSTALENAGVDDKISYQMTGHADGKQLMTGAGQGYRHGLSQDQVYKELCKLDYGDAMANVKPFFEIGGEKRCRVRQ